MTNDWKEELWEGRGNGASFEDQCDFISSLLSSQWQEFVEEIKEYTEECPTHGKVVYEKTDCLDCKEAMLANVVIGNIIRGLQSEGGK